jgi:hypothetical protein
MKWSAQRRARSEDAGEATGKGMDVAGPARGYVVAVFDYKGRPLIVPCIARHAARLEIVVLNVCGT